MFLTDNSNQRSFRKALKLETSCHFKTGSDG